MKFETLTGAEWCCVVGSGPAGVACARALLEKGRKVRMLDAGLTLEATREAAIARLAASKPLHWDPNDIMMLKEGVNAGAKGIPTKLVYGSDFPYRGSEGNLRVDYDGAGVRASLARGGLSNVWGAAMLPYRDQDIQDWPLKISDLAPHYEAVLGFTGLSARHDGLETLFPLYTRHAAPLDLSTQSQHLLAILEKNQSQLDGAGITFGQARIAVAAVTPEKPAGCQYCGMCMYGCPYGYIYNSSDTVRELEQNPNFRYESGLLVTMVRDCPEHAVIQGYHLSSSTPFETTASRVYLAAGAIPTTQILLRSRELYDQPVWLKDSQYFLVPLAVVRSAGDVRHEPLHALSQLFIEICDPSISPATIHLQIYSYNDLIGQAVTNALGPLAKPLRRLGEALERRLLVVQGYLHSSHSGRMAVSLHPEREGSDRLRLKAEVQPGTRRIIRQVLRKLLRHARQIGAWPILPMLQVAEPGRGFHSGGAFPMRRQPGPMETDVLGRPFGWGRVHAVDATVLPDIPATTITFTVMANAHRIATESAKI